jgi:uncharacterized membrane protein YhaH (DUF805 family)
VALRRDSQHLFSFLAGFVIPLILLWSRVKYVSRVIDRSFSGWKINLLFPAESRTPWDVSNANGWLYVVWVAVLIGLLCAPALFARLRLRNGESNSPSHG